MHLFAVERSCLVQGRARLVLDPGPRKEPESKGEPDWLWTQESDSKKESVFFFTQTPSPWRSPIAFEPGSPMGPKARSKIMDSVRFLAFGLSLHLMRSIPFTGEGAGATRIMTPEEFTQKFSTWPLSASPLNAGAKGEQGGWGWGWGGGGGSADRGNASGLDDNSGSGCNDDDIGDDDANTAPTTAMAAATPSAPAGETLATTMSAPTTAASASPAVHAPARLR
jgi:hypothetical protein